MKCDVLVQVSLFKTEKIEKAFLAVKVLCGFIVLFGICKYVTINIVLDKTEVQTAFLKKKQSLIPGPSNEICRVKSCDM